MQNIIYIEWHNIIFRQKSETSFLKPAKAPTSRLGANCGWASIVARRQLFCRRENSFKNSQQEAQSLPCLGTCGCPPAI
jgi:hypothetical protein